MTDTTEHTFQNEPKKVIELRPASSLFYSPRMLIACACLVLIGVFTFALFFRSQLSNVEVPSSAPSIAAASKEELVPAIATSKVPEVVAPVEQEADVSTTNSDSFIGPPMPETKMVIEANLLEKIALLEEKLTEKEQVIQTQKTAQASMITTLRLKEEIESGIDASNSLKELMQRSASNPELNKKVVELQMLLQTPLKETKIQVKEFKVLASRLVREHDLIRDDNPSIMHSIKRHLRSVVVVRPIGKDVEGSSVKAIVARAEAYLDDHDISSALNELNQLPEPAFTSIKPWYMECERRIKTFALLSEIYSMAAQ